MINLIAPHNATGYGVAGQNLLKALMGELGDFLHYEPIGSVDGEIPKVAPVRKDSEDPTIMLWHHQDISKLLERNGPKHLYTFFEVSRLKQSEVNDLNRLDSIVQPSHWGKEVLEQSGVTIPISVAPPGTNRDIFHERVVPTPRNQKPLIMFSCGKWEIRKGYDILLDVFHKAFTKDDEVLLVINAHNFVYRENYFDGPKLSEEWSQYYENSPLGLAGKILINRVRLETQEELASLMMSADLGFFGSRAEGWNLEATEMLSMGKHIILSNTAAHKEFGLDSGSNVIPYDSQELAFEAPWFDGTTYWANPTEENLQYAASLMRVAYDIKMKDGALPVNEAGIKYSKENSWQSTAQKILSSLVTLKKVT